MGELGILVCGQSPPSSTVNGRAEGLPYVSGPDQWTGTQLRLDKWTTAVARLAPEGAIFVTVKGAGVGTVFPGVRAAIGRDIYAFVPESRVSVGFITHALRFTTADVVRQAKGDIPGLSKTHILRHEIPVPPAAEQQRIADTIDELLSDLEDAEAILARVRSRLKPYRASVLKAAVAGSLTAEWRAQHHDVEPASKLLERILAERRRLWEENQLAKFKTKGREPPKTWKAKYKEPTAPEAANLPALPDGWCWVAFDQIAWSVRSGSAETSGRDETDYPVLKSSAVRQGSIDLADLNFLQKHQSLRSENYLSQGDLLITRLSGSVDYVGCSAFVSGQSCEHIQYPDRIFCAKLVPSAGPAYVSYSLRHHRVRSVLEAAAKSTAGHQRISMSDLCPLVLPLPSLREQEAIVEAVEDQLSVIDHLEMDIDAKLKSAQSLRQAILRHAFTGKLVPQDPKDEPASELLKRIAAEREARAREGAAEKRKPRARKAKR